MSAIRRAVVVSICVLSLACGDGGGPSQSSLAFDARLDNQPWRADTAIAIAFGAPTDTTLSVAGARTLSSTQEQEISLALRGFTAAGQIALGDSTAQGIAAFTVVQTSGGVVQSIQVYRTRVASGGYVNISSIDRQDSIVSGTFAFEAALTPDTAPHRFLSGSFRLRFGFVPVFTIP